jgi:outer membrane receptor protein involved in Fe transport
MRRSTTPTSRHAVLQLLCRPVRPAARRNQLDEVTIQGVEIDARWSVTDSSRSSGLGFTRMATSTSTRVVPYTKDNEVPYAPEYTGNWGRGAFPMGDSLHLIARSTLRSSAKRGSTRSRTSVCRTSSRFRLRPGRVLEDEARPVRRAERTRDAAGRALGCHGLGPQRGDENYLAETSPLRNSAAPSSMTHRATRSASTWRFVSDHRYV